MAIPELIPIWRDPETRTGTIGRYEGGQFIGCITGAFPPGYTPGPDWHLHKRWYAVLHRFDHDGHHVGSDFWCPGPGYQGDQQEERLTQWLDALPGREYCDIAIRLFEVTHEGVLFGLVAERHNEYAEGEEEDDWAELYPDGLGFTAPWDGGYDT